MSSLTCSVAKTLHLLLNLVGTLLNYTDNNPTQQQCRHQKYDFIIVGAGASGCVLANRLSEIPEWNVLLLEAGGEEPDVADVPAFFPMLPLTSLDWQFYTEPQNTSCGGKPCPWTRGKVLGGSTVMNTMLYNRGNRRDYDGWARAGNVGWDYESVLRYFKKSENNQDPDIAEERRYHSTGGYLSVGRFPYIDDNVGVLIQGWRELGRPEVDINGESMHGVMNGQATQENGERRSSNKAFLQPVLKTRGNLEVVTHARVSKVLIDPDKKVAYGVEFISERDRKTRTTVFATKEVILSAGAVNSPQILMLSGVGPRQMLEELGIRVFEDLPVGKNLQDHSGAHAVNFLVGNSTRPNSTEQILLDAIKYSQKKRQGPWTAISCLQVFTNSFSSFENPQDDYPDILFSTISSMTNSSSSGTYNINPTRPFCYYNVISVRTSVARPQSRGYLKINTTDPFANIVIYPNYFFKQHDLQVVIEGFKQVVKLQDTKAFKDNGFTLITIPTPGCEHLKYGTDQYWICAARMTSSSSAHPVGSCKMGPTGDTEAVVDPRLRVNGIKNLRVIDASIMPTITSGNTMIPCIMIAEKGADLLKEDHNRQMVGR